MILQDNQVLSKLLGIPGLKINFISQDTNGDTIIRATSTLHGTKCHVCGEHICKPCASGPPIKLRHTPIWGNKTYIRITPLRYVCEHCANKSTTTQVVDWYEQKCSCTKQYEKHILLLLINSTIQDVSIKEDISYDVVEGILERNISTQITWEDIKELKYLGIDEISIKKGHKDFVVIVTTMIEGKLKILAVLKNREKATVKKFFNKIPWRLRQTVQIVCSDLYIGFINAAKEVFGKKVQVVADRFHVAKLYREKLDNVRKKEMRRLKKELPKNEYEKLNNVMWILRKSPTELSEEELKKLKLLFKHSNDLKLSYNLSTDMTAIFNMKITSTQAKRKMNTWINHVRKSGLTCFDSFIKTLTNHMKEITNYFNGRMNSGFVEGG